jgi:hypothetical protein
MQTTVPFIPTSELTEQDFNHLPKVKVTLEKKINLTSNFTTFSLTVHLHTMLNPKIQLKEDRFNLIRLRTDRVILDKLGNEVLKHTFWAPHRFVTGKIKNTDREYKSIQIILGYQLTESHFFNDFNQAACLADLEKNVGVPGKEATSLKIDWQYAPDPIDSAENLVFKNE